MNTGGNGYRIFFGGGDEWEDGCWQDCGGKNWVFFIIYYCLNLTHRSAQAMSFNRGGNKRQTADKGQ